MSAEFTVFKYYVKFTVTKHTTQISATRKDKIRIFTMSVKKTKPTIAIT